MELQSNIVDEFNEFSKNYTEDMARCVPYYEVLLSSFTKNLPNNFLPQKILDFGCGNGNVTFRLLRKFPNAYYTLLDASQEMLNLCKKQFGIDNRSYIESYFQDFEFKKDLYDMVVAGFSLHHCNEKDKKNLFKKIYTSLKSGGVFSCSDLMINKDHKEHKDLLIYWKNFVNKNFPDDEKWKWLMDHYNTYDNPDSLNDQLSWLQKAGFSDFMISIHDNYWVHLKAFKE